MKDKTIYAKVSKNKGNTYNILLAKLMKLDKI